MSGSRCKMIPDNDLILDSQRYNKLPSHRPVIRVPAQKHGRLDTVASALSRSMKGMEVDEHLDVGLLL